ncbi:acyl carrier protein [Streptomyces sp. NPDC049687]|uniref:acyl carrier protein n=1 Tax=Streptomyces sp. NPDC049687 TaxID=3365596 RepID=UPI0037992088
MNDRIVDWIMEKNPHLTQPPGKDDDLIEGRLIDSLAFLEFVYLLEEVTETSIDLSTITAEDFRSLAAIETRFLAAAGQGAEAAR